jgi:UDP-N-acetylglucosamine 2-epimerase (non-hydrolysing)
MKIISVVGARPNFIKIAPFIKAIHQWNVNADEHSRIEHILVHTGQHYDDKMSQSFFKSLDIPDADINLGIGSGSHAYQVGMTMIEFEKVLRSHRPDWVVVVGDVNATCACSITAKKEGIKVAHIEAGLRSHDNGMPEEINRLVTDRLSDLLLTPDRMSSDNLYKEGTDPKAVRFVGNIMIDTLEAQKQKAARLSIDDIVSSNLLPGRSLTLPEIKQKFGVITLHRPSNVDNMDVMNAIINFFINEAAIDLPLLWPVHPRTLKQMQADGKFDKVTSCQNIILLQPLGYHELLKLNIEATVVMSDSGGLQEECCILGTPCLIMRENTERPVTLRENGGVGVLVGNDINLLRSEFQLVMKNITRKFFRPELWDGNTATRIVQELVAAK